jgi:hypothetical protein
MVFHFRFTIKSTTNLLIFTNKKYNSSLLCFIHVYSFEKLKPKNVSKQMTLQYVTRQLKFIEKLIVVVINYICSWNTLNIYSSTNATSLDRLHY